MSEENKPWKIFYRKGTAIIVCGLFLSLIFMVIGWCGLLNYFNEQNGIWFQRSGSIMTVILLFSDYYVYKLSTDIRQRNMIPPSAMIIKDNYRPYITMLKYLAFSLTILATFIWGYGDIIYREFNG